MDQEQRPNEDNLNQNVKSENVNYENMGNNMNNNQNNDHFNIDGKGIVSKFLSFDTFITPAFIKIIYIIGVIFTALTGLGMMFLDRVFAGLVVLLLSPFVPRIWAEMLIVKFKTLEILEEINRNNR